MNMFVQRLPMIRMVAVFMAVCMKMNRAVVMTMNMNMHPLPPQSQEHFCPQSDKHAANRKLQPPRELLAYVETQQQDGATKQQEGRPVTDSPGGAMEHGAFR